MPKKQTKTEKVRAMLARPQGATIAAIRKTTGWQAHSARAALSGLRRTGHTIERTPPGEDRKSESVYRITASPETTS